MPFRSIFCNLYSGGPHIRFLFLGGRVSLDLRFRGPFEAKASVRGRKIDPSGKGTDCRGSEWHISFHLTLNRTLVAAAFSHFRGLVWSAFCVCRRPNGLGDTGRVSLGVRASIALQHKTSSRTLRLCLRDRQRAFTFALLVSWVVLMGGF